MTKLLIGGLLAAASAAALAQAPVQPMAPMQPMRPMADKVMTRGEVQAMTSAMFARLDTNRDGAVTKAEAEAARGQMGQRWQRAGARQANNIQRDGQPMAMRHGGGRGERDPGAMFDRLDANRDSMISRDEFARGHQMRIEKRAMRVGQPGQPGQPGTMRGQKMRKMGGGMGGMGGLRGAMFEQTDINRDGRVTLSEMQSAALGRFDRIDANRDGRVTPDERRAGRATMIQMRKAG